MKKALILILIFAVILIIGFIFKNNQLVVQAPETELANPPASPLPSIKLIPGNEITQGETLRVVFKNLQNASSSFVFQNKTYNFFNYNGEWNALVPFSADTATGIVQLAIGSSTKDIVINPGNFNIVTLVMPKLITSPALVAQYQQEREKVVETYASSKPEIYFNKPFGLPLNNIEITTNFGETYFDPSNNSKSFHNGIDLRADIGTPIMAINDGIVKTADDYILEGKFVMVDHGFGIFSNYLHLSEISVKQGEKVSKGQVIGLTGESGRSVGPHLHFMIKISDVPVNPLLFINIWK